MKDFLLVFRNEPNAQPQPSAEQMQATLKLWMDWVGGIAAQNKLVDRGNRLVESGKVVRPGKVVTDGPYTETKEFIAGYTMIKCANYDEAVEIAKGCPALTMGGNVEVREVNPM